jgi:hypothetical protein
MSRLTKLGMAAIGVVLAIEVHAANAADALIVLTSVGYLTGAADGCRVVPTESNQLASGMALAISRGGYGNQAQAQTLFNNARQKGTAEAAARKVDCAKVSDSVQRYVRSLKGQ